MDEDNILVSIISILKYFWGFIFKIPIEFGNNRNIESTFTILKSINILILLVHLVYCCVICVYTYFIIL